MGTLAEVLSNPLGVVEWFVYLLAAVLFVVGLHMMNSPKTARKGQPDLRGRHGHGGGYGVHRAVRHRDRQRLRASRRRRAADRRHPHRHDRRRVEREEGQDDRHAAARLRVQHGRRRRGGPRRAQRHPHLRGAADAGRADHRRTWHHDRFRHVHRLADRRRQAAGRQVSCASSPSPRRACGTSASLCSPSSRSSCCACSPSSVCCGVC